MVESGDPDEAVATFADAVQVVVDWFDLKNRSRKGGGVRLARTDYLGTAVYEVQAEFGAAGAGGSGGLPIRPAFAAVGDAFVIALSSDHIRNLLDAEMGLSPTLASLPAFGPKGAARRDGSFLVGLAQPALVAQTIDHWLSDESGVLQSFVPVTAPFGSGRTAAAVRLGIRVQSLASGGAVRVVRVEPGGICAGQLMAGDEIRGVNGALLSVDDPGADLKRQVVRGAESRSWMFRVVRDGRSLDVAVANPSGVRLGDPMVALKELASLLGRIDFGSLRASQADSDRMTAELTIRFSHSKDRG